MKHVSPGLCNILTLRRMRTTEERECISDASSADGHVEATSETRCHDAAQEEENRGHSLSNLCHDFLVLYLCLYADEICNSPAVVSQWKYKKLIPERLLILLVVHERARDILPLRNALPDAEDGTAACQWSLQEAAVPAKDLRLCVQGQAEEVIRCVRDRVVGLLCVCEHEAFLCAPKAPDEADTLGLRVGPLHCFIHGNVLLSHKHHLASDLLQILSHNCIFHLELLIRCFQRVHVGLFTQAAPLRADSIPCLPPADVDIEIALGFGLN